MDPVMWDFALESLSKTGRPSSTHALPVTVYRYLDGQ